MSDWRNLTRDNAADASTNAVLEAKHDSLSKVPEDRWLGAREWNPSVGDLLALKLTCGEIVFLKLRKSATWEQLQDEAVVLSGFHIKCWLPVGE